MNDQNLVEPKWPLSRRHFRLPKWAQDQIHSLLCEQINREMEECVKADIRNLCRTATGMNCTFSDDDLRLLAVLAARAVDAGLIDGIGDSLTQQSLRRAGAKRKIAKEAAV